jgi:drug/metabolite transporter (DMT)-like permease
VLLVVFCAASGSDCAVLVRPIMNRHGALRVTAISIGVGAIGLWLAVGAFWSIWIDPTTLTDRPSLAVWSILVLGLWNTTITQLLWFGGLSAAPDITRASYLFFLKPVIAAGLAIFILAQEPTWLQGFAILVVTGSVLVEIYWPRIAKRFARPTPPRA